MPKLRNIRQTQGRHGPEMTADFTVLDGRQGSVSVTMAMWEAQGERALQEEAIAAERMAMTHGYRPPQHDRFRELG